MQRLVLARPAVSCLARIAARQSLSADAAPGRGRLAVEIGQGLVAGALMAGMGLAGYRVAKGPGCFDPSWTAWDEVTFDELRFWHLRYGGLVPPSEPRLEAFEINMRRRRNEGWGFPQEQMERLERLPRWDWDGEKMYAHVTTIKVPVTVGATRWMQEQEKEAAADSKA